MRCWTILTVVTVWLGTTLAFPIEHPSGLYNIALERRSDEPPRPKLTGEQYTAKLQRSLREMQAAFAKDRGLEAKVLKTLGLKVNEYESRWPPIQKRIYDVTGEW